MVSVASLLKPLRESAVDHLEELAVRLAGGEHVSPEETEAIVDRLRATEGELQKAVDRQVRVVGLKREIAEGDKFAKRLQAIESA